MELKINKMTLRKLARGYEIPLAVSKECHFTHYSNTAGYGLSYVLGEERHRVYLGWNYKHDLVLQHNSYGESADGRPVTRQETFWPSEAALRKAGMMGDE